MIITTREGHAIESRAFALSDMVRWGYSSLRNLQTQVGDREAHGVPALHRAARLRAEAVATLRLYCWRGEGPDRQRVDGVWQSRLFRNGPQENATNPVQSRFTFWETVEESLSWRNNAYIWKNVDPGSGQVTDWWALHPDQVIVRYQGGKVIYRIQVADGYVDPVGRGPGRYDVDGSTILHIRGHGAGGQLEAPTPIQVFRDKLAATLGRQRHEARMWRRGVTAQLGIEFPQGVSKEQADQWRESWRSNYEGTEGETTAVVGGGATIKPIGMTAADAQFVEMEHLTVEDASRIMSVPGNLLGVQIARPRPDLEQDLMEWLRFGLGPELGRIEDALYADAELFGGAQTYPGFDTEKFVRGDLLTEATILIGEVQAGILVPDEARKIRGYDPLPDGVGKIPQITPVGGAPNALPALKPKPGKPQNPGGDADADTKSVTVPSIELRVVQDMRAIGEAVAPILERQEAIAARHVEASRELVAGWRDDVERRAGLEESREQRALRAEQRALEPVEPPTVVVNVEPTPVTVSNVVNVPETPVTVNIAEAAEQEQMQIEFARDGYGLIKGATVKPKGKK